MPLGEPFAQEWQHRGVGEMEHHGGDEEDDQPAILDERLFHLDGPPAGIRAAGNLIVNFGGFDEGQGGKRRDRDNHHEEENAPIGQKVAEEAHGQGRDHVACGVEGLVAALAEVEGGTSDDPQGDGADGWAEYA